MTKAVELLFFQYFLNFLIEFSMRNKIRVSFEDLIDYGVKLNLKKQLQKKKKRPY